MRKPPASRPSAISSSTSAASLRRQPSDAGQIGRRQLAGRCQDEPGELARAQRRAPGAACGSFHLRVEQVVRERAPTAPPARRDGSSSARAGGAATAIAAVDVLLRQRPSLRAEPGPVSGPGARIARRPARSAAARLRFAATSAGSEARRDTRRRRARDACRRRRGRGRQLVLRPPDEAHLVGPAHERPVGLAHGPVGSALPETCSQSDGRTTSAFGKRSARPTSSIQAAAASSVRSRHLVCRQCPRSSRSVRFATTRRSPGRSTSSSRRPTT